jgi:protoheme IX farnesyltransferase
MSTSIYTNERLASKLWDRSADYFELMKPKIASLELVTVAAAAFVAGWVPESPLTLLHALLGTALVAASASAMNHFLERDTDAKMQRTASRPLPTGRMTSRSAIIFAAVTGMLGVGYLLAATNVLTAALALATWVLYVGVYTPLKSRTTLNTPVGAVAGALPILIGWSAGGAALGPMAWVLFAIVFIWQFPHFMAIAWIYRKQYERAGLQMSPVVCPSGRSAARQAIGLAALLVPVSLVPVWLTSEIGAGYFFAALMLGVVQLAFAVVFGKHLSDASARRLLRASVIYLPALLLLLMFSPLIS